MGHVETLSALLALMRGMHIGHWCFYKGLITWTLRYFLFAEQAVEWTVKFPVIWDAMTLKWCHCTGLWICCVSFFRCIHLYSITHAYHHILIYFKTPIWNTIYNNGIYSLIARFMGPTWGPPGADRTQVGHMWATWTFLSGLFTYFGL